MGKRDKRKPKQGPGKGSQELTDQAAQHGFWLPGHGGEPELALLWVAITASTGSSTAGQADPSEPPSDAVGEAPQQMDVLELYQQAVQSPAGDISYLLRFFRDLVGPQVCQHCHGPLSEIRQPWNELCSLHGCQPGSSLQHPALQVPLHLREDFCGSALISAMWCKADVRRSAVGIDLDRLSLVWGWEHNSIALLGAGAERLCLLHANVRWGGMTGRTLSTPH